jgi:equilibrative nucleoside transporter 1/2/3
VIVFFLNLSTSYFQSAALALASLWGSTEILAALSGQGGVAVLISLVQVVLAIVGALGSDQDAGNEAPSMLAGVGLWGLGSVGAGLCWLAFRFLTSHPAYERVVASSREAVNGTGVGKKSNWNRTVKVLDKNKLLYLAVALDFAITLVSRLDQFRRSLTDVPDGIPGSHIPNCFHTYTPSPTTPSRRFCALTFLHFQWSVANPLPTSSNPC